MRLLLVGDIHAVPEELEDCARLRELVDRTAHGFSVDATVLLGDGHHTHNVIRAEVMAFYREWFKDPKRKISLIGNHDYAGEGNPIHAMQIYEDQIKVIDRPQALGGVLFMSYYADRERFVQDANSFPNTKTLVCHQTFVGSKYENGLPALDGIDASRIPQARIISGHIHTPQSFDNVTYIGAPRWRSLSDANLDRAIWVYDFDADGNVTKCFSVDTGEYCRQVRYVHITPEDLFGGEMDPKHDWRLDISGPSDFVTEQKRLWSKPGVKVRTFVTDRRVARVRESEGIGTAFRKYLKDYTAPNGTSTETLDRMARERLAL